MTTATALRWMTENPAPVCRASHTHFSASISAILPAEPLLEADILGTRFEKCVSCGAPIIKKGNRKKYCEKCAQRAYKAQQAEYARRKRAESKNRR